MLAICRNYRRTSPQNTGRVKHLRLMLVLALVTGMFSVLASVEAAPLELDSKHCPESISVALEDAETIRCGWLEVPEDRINLAGNWIDLFVVRIGSREFAEDPPLLVLAGGPGDAASADIDFWLESNLHTEHDIILVDQRGTGHSRPSLDCPESGEADGNAWMAACRDRLTRQGINLSSYHAMSTVWDLHDLLDALELERVNLYGSSYGSRLALLLANSAPQRIRSMTLDGVYPPSRHDLAELAANVELSLERLFQDCANDPACQRRFPDLREQFYRVFMELNESPAELYHLGESTGMTMDGDTFALMIASFLRHPIALPFLPLMIASVERGQHDFVFWVYGFVIAEYGDDAAVHSEGAYYSVRCPEDQLFSASELQPPQDGGKASALATVLRVVVEDQVASCAAWNLPPASSPAALEYISDVPALLLSGAYDSATPPHWADEVAEHLNAVWNYIFPNVSHGVLEDEPCAREIMSEFLLNPQAEPEAPCLDALGPPEFVAHQSAAE